jgi:transcriptional regulator with XRE-family HTH domain
MRNAREQGRSQTPSTPTSRISEKLLNQVLIGIRERLERGDIIRKALCAQAGISPSYLSRLLSEGLSNRSIPSRTLKQIVSAVEPEGLSGFIRKSERTLFCIRRSGDAPEISSGLFPDCTALDLSRGFVGRTMFPFMLSGFAIDGALPSHSYFLPSERFIYVVEGALRLHTVPGHQPILLKAGDAVYVPEFQPHFVTAQTRSAKAVTILWDLQGVRPQALYTRGGMRLSHKSKADGLDGSRTNDESDYWHMVGLRIQALRTRCGLTQELLAQLCGLPEAELRQIESGRRAPSIEKLTPEERFERIENGIRDLITGSRTVLEAQKQTGENIDTLVEHQQVIDQKLLER